MMIKAILTNADTQKRWDVSELIETGIKWSTQYEGSFPGSLQLTILDDDQIKISNGDKLSLIIDGHKIFNGTVRKFGFSKEGKTSISVYDSKYLLKSKDTIVFKAGTVSSRFSQVCKIAGILHKIVNAASYKCPKYVADSKSFYEMIDESLNATKKATGKKYMLSDNFGTLEFIEQKKLITSVVIGDGSLVTDFSYENSIENMINSVKVIKDGTKKSSRQVSEAKDAKSVKKYGLLQDVETPKDSKMNKAQIQNQAKTSLKSQNKAEKTLTLECIGEFGVKAGSVITLKLTKLKKVGLYNKKFFVKKCDHTFGKTHTMSLELEVV